VNTGGGGAAVAGFDGADRGEQLPGEAGAGGRRLLVEAEVVGWDRRRGGAAGQRCFAAERGGDEEDGEEEQRGGGGERAVQGVAEASSAGSLVAQACSVALAVTRSGKRLSPTTKSPLPRGQVSR
jgi:hypothetical protein